MLQEYSKAIITMLAVINPAVSGMIFLQITANESRKGKLREATKAALKIVVILVTIAFTGKYILNIFGISIESFGIVGGAVIAYIGFSMLSGRMQKNAAETSGKTNGKLDNSPLIMFSASPGTIATLITISLNDSDKAIPTEALIAVGISMLITWFVMVLMSLMPPTPKKESGTSFATQFMGLILIAMGLQFVLEGYKAFMMM